MIKEHTKPGSGTGGTSVTGVQSKPDSTPTETTAGGTSDLTKGGDPLSGHNPGTLPGHMKELHRHAGDKVAKGGSSQAGSVGPYIGE